MITKINNPVLDLTSPSISNGAVFSSEIDMGGNDVTNLPLIPGDNADAASKFYVDQVASTTGGGVFLPAGFGPLPWAGTTPVPSGWLLCDGEEYDQTVYPELYAAIGTTYNTGGETAGFFRVPDMRGIAAVGLDDMNAYGSTRGPAGNITDPTADTVGGFLGAEDHTLTIAEMPAHDHGGGSFASDTHTHSLSGLSTSFQAANGFGLEGGGPNTRTDGHSHTVSGSMGTPSSSSSISSEGSGDPHNNLQPSRFFAWIIKDSNSVVGFPGDIDMNGNKIINLGDPTSDTDATNKQYVDKFNTYDVAMFRSGLNFTTNNEILRLPSVRSFSIPANFTDSRAESRTTSTANATFEIWKNSTQIGTITFSIGTSTGSFVDNVVGPHDFTNTDVLRVVDVNTDATLEDVGIVLFAELT